MYKNLKALRESLGMKQDEFGASVGVKKTTYQGYESGQREPKSDFWIAVAEKYHVSIDYLMDFTNDPKPSITNAFVSDSDTVLRTIDPIFDSLNAPGQKELCRYGKYLTTLDEYRREDEAPIVDLIPEYLTPAAAGYASPIEGEDFEMIQRPADAPENADFCIKISGDSMEPFIKDGQRVYVKRGAHLESFDVGIFFVAGDVFCKQYCPGYAGQLYLLSANPDRQDANVILSADDARGCMCFGKVLLKKRPPKPSYF